jgi:hypothetical protein
MKKLKNIIFLIWLIPLLGVSQTTLQVATKSVEKSFEEGKSLKIEAEKADIELITWNNSTVKVSLELIAKHPDRKTASTDLELMKYVLEKAGNGILLRNFFIIENPKNKPSSNFKAKYIIRIPENMELTITNSFGKILLRGKAKQLTLKTDFCTTELKDLSGIIKANTHYGELSANKIEGEINIRSERTDLIFSQLGGRCTIFSIYGNLTIQSLNNLKNLKIDAQKTDISLIGILLKSHQFYLLSEYGKLKIPSDFSVTSKENGKIAVLEGNLNSRIQIKNSFGNTTIEDKQ